jgi:hypothetical protein
MKIQSKSNRVFIFFILFGLVSLSCNFSRAKAPAQPTNTQAAAATPVETNTPRAAATHLPELTRTEVSTQMDQIQVDYVYTSELITILYPLYGSTLDDFAIITLTNNRALPARILVQSEITGYTDLAADTIDIAAGETVEVRQNPRLQPKIIADLNVEKPAQFHLRVSELAAGDEKLLLEETKETLVYARRDFPWSIQGFSDEEVFDLLASMVTPNDPSVEELLRAAANYTESGIIWSGYGGHVNDDDGGVWDRLQAVWEAEDRDYNLTYISTWVSLAPGSVQRIRLPAEVLEQHSGNCIETSLLYASAVEAMDMEVAIIGIPGHAYVGVRMDQENANYYFIETTLIGRATFNQAVEKANAEFQETLPHLDAKESGYGWVTVWDARQKGITPLPWR